MSDVSKLFRIPIIGRILFGKIVKLEGGQKESLTLRNFVKKNFERKTLIVGNDVWIGHGVSITNGCSSIGNGAVIGAGSVVTHDIPAYAIAVGNPAKVIKYRLERDTIEALEKSKWWDLTPYELMQFYDDMDEPIIFTNKVINWKNQNK